MRKDSNNEIFSVQSDVCDEKLQWFIIIVVPIQAVFQSFGREVWESEKASRGYQLNCQYACAAYPSKCQLPFTEFSEFFIVFCYRSLTHLICDTAQFN